MAQWLKLGINTAPETSAHHLNDKGGPVATFVPTAAQYISKLVAEQCHPGQL